MMQPLNGVHVLLIEDDPSAWLSFLEERMDTALADEDPNALWHLAQAVAFSKYPALGVFVCRSVAPFLSPKEASSVLEDLSKARDRLGLLPEDPITDIVDKVWAKENDETSQSEAVQEALQSLRSRVGVRKRVCAPVICIRDDHAIMRDQRGTEHRVSACRSS